ncbi:MAG: HAMP domain-containing sensor histidine kinase [Desulfosalsimonas sp.]|uniref:sensor histidine kinase n=1 Tax=Desulfosalsimonas sp. TaxID=3073848 RepID=UPI0039706482
MTQNPVTEYAPASRSDKYAIDRQRKLLAEYQGSLQQFYEAVCEIVLIVNANRQIVFFNSIFPSLLNVDNPENLYGLRPGEAMGCMYACSNPGGCGTSRFCTQCGAVNSILSALNQRDDLQECRLLKDESMEAFELLVRTTPLEVQGQLFSIVAITDISHEKRRWALERIFFHDMLNTAAGLRVFAQMLNDEPDNWNAAVFRNNLLSGIEQLTDAIYSQKELLEAENNELEVKKQPVDPVLLARQTVETFQIRFPQHRMVVREPEQTVTFKTDARLLNRVLGNMLLNAIEASSPEQTVTLTIRVGKDEVEFRVHNPTPVSRENKLQLFQRSFSTKGPGRGLGTYSMKLLTERYLNGWVSADSSPERGTTFSATYPL